MSHNGHGDNQRIVLGTSTSLYLLYMRLTTEWPPYQPVLVNLHNQLEAPMHQ